VTIFSLSIWSKNCFASLIGISPLSHSSQIQNRFSFGAAFFRIVGGRPIAFGIKAACPFGVRGSFTRLIDSSDAAYNLIVSPS
jgi:hypothetical protein